MEASVLGLSIWTDVDNNNDSFCNPTTHKSRKHQQKYSFMQNYDCFIHHGTVLVKKKQFHGQQHWPAVLVSAFSNHQPIQPVAVQHAVALKTERTVWNKSIERPWKKNNTNYCFTELLMFLRQTPCVQNLNSLFMTAHDILLFNQKPLHWRNGFCCFLQFARNPFASIFIQNEAYKQKTHHPIIVLSNSIDFIVQVYRCCKSPLHPSDVQSTVLGNFSVEKTDAQKWNRMMSCGSRPV